MAAFLDAIRSRKAAGGLDVAVSGGLAEAIPCSFAAVCPHSGVPLLQLFCEVAVGVIHAGDLSLVQDVAEPAVDEV